ncbi:MAG: HYR domain-containing protein [Bacteroidia bacterium]
MLNTVGGIGHCQARITVRDSIPPVVNCPATATINLPQNGLITDRLFTATVTDNCDTGAPSSVLASFSASCGKVGRINNLVFAASDTFGIVGTCTTRVTVNDNFAPSLGCPSNMTVSASSGSCSASVNYLVLHQDFCSSTLTQTDASGLSSGDVFPVGTTVQSYKATDPSGNADSCSFTVTVEDREPPVLSCPLDTVFAADYSCEFVWNYSVSGSDACGTPTLRKLQGVRPGDEFRLGANLVQWEASDAAGNKDTCSFTVTVNDSTAPKFVVCPPSITVNSEVDTCGSGFFRNVLVDENCSFTMSRLDTSSYVEGDLFPIGSTTLSYRAADAAGNADTCTFTITVYDGFDPEIHCPGDTVLFSTDSSCSISYHYAISAFDVCGIDTTVQIDNTGLTSGDAFPPGATVQSWVASDMHGNTDSCSFSVTVLDTIAPVLTCPGSLVMGNDSGACGAVFTYSINASDNCPFTLTQTDSSGYTSGDLFPVGTTSQQWTVSDASGNSKNCGFSITVNDSTPPVFLSCPPNDTVLYSDSTSCSVAFNYAVSARDNCLYRLQQSDGSGLTTGDPFPLGTTLQQWIATDSSGNTDTCSFTVTVRDNIPPRFNCPQDRTLYLHTDSLAGSSTFVDYLISASDNCGFAPFAFPYKFIYATFDCEDVGPNPFSFGFTDKNGNRSTCQFTITIVDSTAPVISGCPSDTVLSNDAGACGAVFSYSLSSSDFCGDTLFQIDNSGLVSGDEFPVGTTLQQWTALDPSGNADTCTFRVTVNDTIAPSLLCHSGFMVHRVTDSCELAVSIQARFTDNCDPPRWVRDTFLLTPDLHILTLHATDRAGNAVSCNGRVILLDDEDPVMSCPDSIVVAADPGLCGALVNYSISFTDNCPNLTRLRQRDSSGLSSGDIFPVGTTEQYYTATSYGSGSNCRFNVIVRDSTPPRASCLPQIVRQTIPAEACSMRYPVSIPWTDNCTAAGVYVDTLDLHRG